MGVPSINRDTPNEHEPEWLYWTVLASVVSGLVLHWVVDEHTVPTASITITSLSCLANLRRLHHMSGHWLPGLGRFEDGQGELTRVPFGQRLRPSASWLLTQSPARIAEVRDTSPANTTAAMISASLSALPAP